MEELKKMTFKEKDALLRSIKKYHKRRSSLKVLKNQGVLSNESIQYGSTRK